jgi:RNA polymerase sigma factor (sigma-70 family)
MVLNYGEQRPGKKCPLSGSAGNILSFMPMADGELLKQYVAGSQEAFAELVARHARWVYCVARRRVGDEHLAEDVTQAVFILLAQKAWKIGPDAALGPWLAQTAGHVARHALRSRRRRARHEQAAAGREVIVEEPSEQANRQELADLVDQSLLKLAAADQQAVILRFYQEKSLEEIGREMGSSQESARKRIKRALERLRNSIQVTGLWVAPDALEQWMMHHAVGEAPAHLTAASSAAALAGTSGTSEAFNIAKGANRMLMWSKIRIAAAIVLVVLLPGIFCVNALQKWAGAQEEMAAPPAAATVDAAMANYSQSQHLMLNVSQDGTRIWGFSMLTGGKWAEASAPPGATFDKSSVCIASDVGVAQAGDRFFGFSPGTGTWDVVQLPDGGRVNCEISDNVACFQAGDRLYALSGMVGGWDSIQLPPGIKVEFAVGPDFAMAHFGTHMWAFGAAGGKWAGIDTGGR